MKSDLIQMRVSTVGLALFFLCTASGAGLSLSSLPSVSATGAITVSGSGVTGWLAT